MLSDESSSDSETGRFKGQSEKQDDPRNSNQKEDKFKHRGRGRASESARFRKEFERKRDEKDRSERFPRGRERIRYSRHSPPNRRRYSRERSPNRRLHDRHKHSRESRARSRSKGHRSNSKERWRRSGSKSRKSPDNKKEETKHSDSNKEKRTDKQDRKTREKSSLSPDYKNKKSEIHKPLPIQEPPKKKSESPVVVEELESDHSVDVQPGSYYNMIPAVIKDKSEESSEIDSSDDERLRAKLLNLEKELRKTRKKKHKKKHKRRTSKSNKERDQDNAATVEVSSTTDIKIKTDISSNSQLESTEVTSTQKSTQKESSEEGEISSEDSQTNISIDPTDLRHKLKRSIQKGDKIESQNVHENVKPDVCGPVLPPHLQKNFRRSGSIEVEGPILPPHLQKQDGTIGPTIPEDMRKILAETEREIIKYESSDEDIGIGPLPVDAQEKWSDAHKHLEERALDMKIRALEGHSLQISDVKSREKWMLELPEAKAKYLGLEARTFRAKEGPDMSDRSSWTDTPEEKARKLAGIAKEEDAVQTLKREAKTRQIANRDDEQEKEAKKHKKKHKREESLLEIHQKKLKKKKKKEEKESDKKERRPFSRDVDLEVNRFDEAQKKSIIKKAQALDSRFSRGEAKYL